MEKMVVVERTIMSDDEKYPIAVDPEGQVYAVEKMAVAGVSPNSVASPDSAHPPPDYMSARRETHREFLEAQLPPREPTPWFKRPIVVLLLVLILLVMGAIIGGASYAIHQRDHRIQDIGINTTKASSASSSTTSNNTRNSVASSGLFLKDKTTWNMQTFTQNEQGNITYQVSLDGITFGKSSNMSLSIPAKIGSPLAATASTDTTGVVYLSLFYISTTNHITMATAACPAGSTSCSKTGNYQVTETLTIPMRNDTGLAAVNVDDAQDWRVFYHDKNNMISQLAGNNSGFDSGQVIGGEGLPGSSIAATNINSTTNNINVFYVDDLTSALYTFEFTNDWTTPKSVSPERVDFWNPLSGLSACYTKSSGQIHMYYTGLDTLIYEFLGSKVSTRSKNYATQPGQNHIWGAADIVGADIASVGWKDQVRFFQINDNKMAMGNLNNTLWTEAFVVNTS